MVSQCERLMRDGVTDCERASASEDSRARIREMRLGGSQIA